MSAVLVSLVMSAASAAAYVDSGTDPEGDSTDDRYGNGCELLTGSGRLLRRGAFRFVGEREGSDDGSPEHYGVSCRGARVSPASHEVHSLEGKHHLRRRGAGIRRGSERSDVRIDRSPGAERRAGV